MLRYSAERFPDGTVIIFFHCLFGVVPYIQLTQDELVKFIEMLGDCVDLEKLARQSKGGISFEGEIPEVFKKAFDDEGLAPA